MSTQEDSNNTITETRLSILGMSCAGCVAAVEGALKTIEGVTAVNVNFADHSALVKGTADIDLLTQVLKNSGYDAAVMVGFEDPEEQAQQYRNPLRKKNS